MIEILDAEHEAYEADQAAREEEDLQQKLGEPEEGIE